MTGRVPSLRTKGVSLYTIPREWRGAYGAFATPRRRFLLHAFVVLGVFGSYLLIGWGGRSLGAYLMRSGHLHNDALYEYVLPISMGVVQFVSVVLIVVTAYRVVPAVWLFYNRMLPICRQCGYSLDRHVIPGESVEEPVVCPECGTINDASKWVMG